MSQTREALSSATVDVSPSAAPTHVRFLVVGFACLLAIVTYLHRVGFSAIAPNLLKQLGLDDFALGSFTAAFMIAYGLFEVPWGLLGDVRGGKTALIVIVIGGSLLTASVALVMWLPDPARMGLAFLVLVRFLFGVFQAGTFPVLSRIMADWLPADERGGAQGAIWMSTRLGGALAPVLLVPLFQKFGNWRIPLAIGATFGLVWCAGFAAWFRNKPEEKASVNPAELALIQGGRKTKTPVSHRVPWGAFFGRANPLALFAMYGCLGFSGNFFLFLLPNYLETKRHLAPGARMWLTSLPFFCGVFACVLGGVFSDALGRRFGSRRWGRRAVGFTGLAIGAIGIVSTLAVTDVTALGVLLCLTFIGNDLAMGPAWAAATEIGDKYAGTLGGVMNMSSSFTAAAAMFGAGYLFSHGDVVTPFVVFGLVYAVGALCWLRIDVTEPLLAPGREDDGLAEPLLNDPEALA